MRRGSGWQRRARLAAVVLAAASLPAARARAEVVSVTLGIDSTCPYGVVG